MAELRLQKCWIKDCAGRPVGGQGEKGICKKHLDEARAEGRNPFLPPSRKKEKLRRVAKESDGTRSYGIAYIDSDGIQDSGTKEEMLARYKPEHIFPLIQKNPPR